MLILLWLLINISECFSATQPCISTLPYRTTFINFTEYEMWYGKVGENINGTTYTYGHVFSRHVAVNYKCTS